MRLSLVSLLYAVATTTLTLAAPLPSSLSAPSPSLLTLRQEESNANVTQPFAIQIIANTPSKINNTFLTVQTIDELNLRLLVVNHSCIDIDNVPDSNFTFDTTNGFSAGLGELLYTTEDNGTIAANYGPYVQAHPNNYPFFFGGSSPVTVFELDEDDFIRIKLSHAGGFYICPYQATANSTEALSLQWNNYAAFANQTGCSSVSMKAVFLSS